MSKHTPGPWMIEGPCGPDVKRGHIHIIDSPGSTVATITPGAPHPIDDEEIRQANARLIAAAPTLLEACKAAFALFAATEKSHHESGGTMKRETTERPVLVTTAHRGVFFGYATETDGPTIRLRGARLCVYWSADLVFVRK